MENTSSLTYSNVMCAFNQILNNAPPFNDEQLICVDGEWMTFKEFAERHNNKLNNGI